MPFSLHRESWGCLANFLTHRILKLFSEQLLEAQQQLVVAEVVKPEVKLRELYLGTSTGGLMYKSAEPASSCSAT